LHTQATTFLSPPGGIYLIIIIYFIYFINSIQLNYLLTFLKDARTRRLPESTARSGRARSHGLTGPLSVRLCDPYMPRTTSTDAPRNLNPSMLVSSHWQQKNQKNQKIQKKKILVDPGRHFPVPYILFSGPEGPEPALGSLGATCSVVMREIHYHADVALASRPSCLRTGCGAPADG
jgi:hypothetical protein